MREIVHEENLAWLRRAPAGAFSLVYIDPPFNSGRRQTRTRLRTTRTDEASGDRVGFGGKRYRTERVGVTGFDDRFESHADYIEFLRARIEAARRVMTADGSLFLHVDSRESHYCKVMLDEVFGRDSFMNEIIWAYDYGARSRKRWSPKHDNIFWYVNDPNDYIYDHEAIDRIPYLAPALVGPEKAARGKTPTDVWWHTIVPTNGRERTGYATQKPLGILERIVKVHSRPGDTVLDFFAGSGSFGEAAARHGRGFVLVDRNPEAIAIMRQRLRDHSPTLTPERTAAQAAPSPSLTGEATGLEHHA